DVLRELPLRLSERSATRSVAPGGLLMGWVSRDLTETFRLEGGVYYVPPFVAEATVETVRDMRDEIRRQLHGLEWRRLHAQLPPALVAGARSAALTFHTQLANTSGHALQFATARYTVVDLAAARATLDSTYVPCAENTWNCVSPDDV